MKDYYKINEIAKLYGIGVDSLRYYERLGILKPRRDTNGYRLYPLKEMYKLNMIRDLRQLHFSMAQIKEYLDDQTVDNTLRLLRQEEDLVAQQLSQLEHKARLLEQRVETLEAARAIVPGQVTLKQLPSRPCVLFTQHITRDEEMDFVMKKLQRQHEDKILDFGNQVFGAFLAMEELLAGTPNVYDGVFSVVGPGEACDFTLPGGRYLSLHYRGPYEQNREVVQQLLAHAAAQGLSPVGQPFELYAIDNRDTVRPEEFLTEVQVAVTARVEASAAAGQRPGDTER